MTGGGTNARENAESRGGRDGSEYAGDRLYASQVTMTEEVMLRRVLSS